MERGATEAGLARRCSWSGATAAMSDMESAEAIALEGASAWQKQRTTSQPTLGLDSASLDRRCLGPVARDG